MSDSMAIALPPLRSLPIEGHAARYPIRRVYCVGRNYAAHAQEMGHDPAREPPFFFGKPGDAVVESGRTLAFPILSEDVQHEVELVVAIGTAGSDIGVEQALDFVFGYAVGLDMTKRDMQSVAKRLGRPWDLSKGFDESAICGRISRPDRIGHPVSGAIRLEVNGETRQLGDLADQIWNVQEVISHLSRYVRILPGDLIMTGTPAGVGRVLPGDQLVGSVEGVGRVQVVYNSGPT